ISTFPRNKNAALLVRTQKDPLTIGGLKKMRPEWLSSAINLFSLHWTRLLPAATIEEKTTPPQCPQANALCERLIGTLRRECMDGIIPLSAHHVGRILTQWVLHYNAGRPHMSLGPGIPQPPVLLPVPLQPTGTGYQHTRRSGRGRSWAACIMNMGWTRKQRS